MRSQTQEFFSYLQDKICSAIEEVDGEARFREDNSCYGRRRGL
jgi:coproporphyrinogen III oxidase